MLIQFILHMFLQKFWFDIKPYYTYSIQILNRKAISVSDFPFYFERNVWHAFSTNTF